MNKFSFPIRLKVLITVTVMLMLVVGVITSTMANLFHKDKTAYVRDYSAGVTEDIRTGAGTILSGYISATRMLSEVLFADYIDSASKNKLTKPIFAAYPDLIAFVSTNSEGEPVLLYNATAMQAANIEPDGVLGLAAPASRRDDADVVVQMVRTESGQELVTLTASTVSADNSSRTVVAVISPTRLKRVLRRAGAFDAVLLGPDRQPIVTTGDNGNDVRWAHMALSYFESLGASRVVEYELPDGHFIAAAGRVEAGDLTVVTRISASAAYLTARQLLNNLIIVGLVIVVIALLGGVLVSRRLTGSLEHLSQAVRKIAKGDFNVSVEIDSGDEIGQLSRSFNEMADELNVREHSLRKAQLALVQSEKMAAVGTLSAGLAHEVKNPLSAVLGYAQLAKRKLSNPESLKEHLDTIETETRRCNDIIGNLMRFSRVEKGAFAETSINEVVKKSVGIVDHQLALKNVRIETDLGEDLPPILGNANQLQQVLMNLAINAQQAIGEDGGTVSFRTAMNDDNDSVVITVDDTGPGIDDEVAASIFEPFFTTKAAGDGTGLGLSVTYGIIQDHKGDITVSAAPGGGARFEIRLPINVARETGAENTMAMESVS
ncbi:MAG: HAMP domain-containing protein [Gammaproteobacteria bacterium]|nr:HAMP domain-containing protein [Gammaproteobacteria bacterium]